MLQDGQAALAQRIARADLCRFLAACYYEPGREFVEEKLFDSLVAVAELVDAELADSARRLGETFQAETLENLLVDYTRLFLAAPQALAQPYESAWTGESSEWAQVLTLYREAGFDLDGGFRDRPDHIAVELELLYRLLHDDAAPELRIRLLRKHLARWATPFAQAVEAGARTAFYRQLGQLTRRVVAFESDRV
ncbi:MAG TPA: molecular chaperone TorD family protein [Burkholderiales bacterium]